VKFKSQARFYALASQGIITMLMLTGLGYLIGYLVNKESVLKAILAVVGAVFGVCIFVSYLLYLIKIEEKEKKKEKDKDGQGTKD